MTGAIDMERVVREYFTCLDTEDWARMAELWTSDGCLRAVGARPRDGREEVIGYFSKLFDPWPAHEDRPTRIVVAEHAQTVLAEVTFYGTTPGGKAVRFDAVDVFDLRDGRICALSNWYDVAYARAALSVA